MQPDATTDFLAVRAFGVGGCGARDAVEVNCDDVVENFCVVGPVHVLRGCRQVGVLSVRQFRTRVLQRSSGIRQGKHASGSGFVAFGTVFTPTGAPVVGGKSLDVLPLSVTVFVQPERRSRVGRLSRCRDQHLAGVAGKLGHGVGANAGNEPLRGAVRSQVYPRCFQVCALGRIVFQSWGGRAQRRWLEFLLFVGNCRVGSNGGENATCTQRKGHSFLYEHALIMS